MFSVLFPLDYANHPVGLSTAKGKAAGAGVYSEVEYVYGTVNTSSALMSAQYACTRVHAYIELQIISRV